MKPQHHGGGRPLQACQYDKQHLIVTSMIQMNRTLYQRILRLDGGSEVGLKAYCVGRANDRVIIDLRAVSADHTGMANNKQEIPLQSLC